MKVISIINWKGGVGKTTSTLHLGAYLATNKTKVLVIDFDPQRNLSLGFGCNYNDCNYTVKNFLDGTKEFKIVEKQKNLYLLAGDKLIEQKTYTISSLADRLKLLNSQFKFDYVLIDCPPRPLVDGVVSLGQIALAASDYVISPILAELYSLAGINDMILAILKIKEKYNNNLEFLGFFFSKVLVRVKRFKKTKSNIEKSAAEKFLLTSYIRQDEAIERAKEQGKTIYQVAPNSRASLDYKKLSREIKKKIKKNE